MIRKFIEFSVNKPVLNHIFLLFLVVVAVIAYRNIPKEIFPPSNLDAINISGVYVGASADILDKMAVKSIEDELKNLSDIAEIDTVIKSGFFNIKADLKDGIKAENAIDDIKDIISNIKRDLPSDMDEPTAKILKHSFPLVLIAVASKGKPKEELLEVADKLKSELSGIKDLSDVVIRGDADEELLFFLDEMKIDAYGLNKSAVIDSIKRLSSIFPIGIIKERGSHLFLSTLNGEKDKSLIENTIISVNNKKLFIKDIAKVKFQLSDSDQISHYNGKQNISVNVSKSEMGNAIALVKDIKKILKEYEEKYEGFEFNTYTDTSIWIKNRLNTVVSNILFGLILVFLSMYFFINSRIAIVVAIGIPVSFMTGLIFANILGYSLNMLSLLGALIALGMLVDEAIVVAENIYRHMENGDDPKTAAINGAVEMFPAVLTATATTVFAFLPLLMVSGEIGIFIKILPIMISILLISSLFEAFFFLPLHAKDILVVHKENDDTMWKKFNRLYTNILSFMLKFKKVSLFLLVVGIISLTVIMVKQSKFQLFPQFDTTQIYISGKVDVNNELKDTEEIITKLEKELLKDISEDEVSSITSVIGLKLDAKNQAELAEYYFHIFINLHESAPKDFYNTYINPHLSPEYDAEAMIRTRDATFIADDLKEIVDEFKEMKTERGKVFEELNVIVPQAGIIKSDVEISFAGDDDKIKEAINMAKEAMNEIEGVHNITDDLFEGERELKFRVNEYGQSLGIDESIIFNNLKPFFLKGEHSKMFNEKGLIRVKFQSIEKDSFKTLSNFYLNIENKKVKLSEVVDFIYQPSFAKIIKEDGKRIRSVFASLKKKEITSAEFLKLLEPTLDEIKKSVEVMIKGEEKENERIKTDFAEAGIIALFLIFISLVWMFDSSIKALMVISTIPLAILGVLVGHKIMGINLTMPSMIGIVGLTGVIVNDGLIMLDFIRKATTIDDIAQRAKLRLRPILLTSLTTVLGLATLIFFPMGQSLILQPMAITIGFGLLWATVLNLYYIPILYSVVYKRK